MRTLLIDKKLVLPAVFKRVIRSASASMQSGPENPGWLKQLFLNGMMQSPPHRSSLSTTLLVFLDKFNKEPYHYL